MKILYLILLTAILNLSAAQSQIRNKSFIAHIGSVCVETSQPDPCAGYQIYLQLDFKGENVTITEKNISTCNKEDVKYSFTTKYTFNKSGEIKLSDNKKIANTFADKLNLKITKNQLTGYKLDWQHQLKEYQFKIVSKVKSNRI